MSDEESDFRGDVLRHFGRMEALAEAHAKQARDRHYALVEDVRLLKNEVTRSHERLDEHDELLTKHRDRTQQSSHDLSEFQAEALKKEQAVAMHIKKLEGAIGDVGGKVDTIAGQNTGQNLELGKQTRQLSRIEVITPIVVAIATVIQYLLHH